jgi:hypothetical protein
MKFVRGGAGVVFHERPKLVNDMPILTVRQNLYRTPVWASVSRSPVSSLIKNSVSQIRSFCFLPATRAEAAGKCFVKLKKDLSKNTVMGNDRLSGPKTRGSGRFCGENQKLAE